MSGIYRWLLLAMVLPVPACTSAAWNSLTAPAGPSEVVQTRKLVVVDGNGKPVAELGAAQEGSGLVLMDTEGKPRAAMVLTANGEPGLKLYDAAGEVRAALIVGNDGRAGLALYDARGKDRAALATDTEGNPALILLDRKGRVAAAVPSGGQHPHARPR